MANLAEFSPISEISTEKTFWNLKARVIRLWQVSDFNRNTLPFSTEMVLMDEAGNRIHATIKKNLLYKFKNDIFEGRCFSFENMGVANNGGNYRTTRHNFKLNFQFGSKVVFLPNLSITKSPYNFVPIPEIVGGAYDTDYLPDLCGFLTGVGSEREIQKGGKTYKLNVIELESLGHKVQCTLFGSYVDDLNNFIASGDVQNAIVIIQLAKAKIFQDKLHVQNCLNCTRVIYNPTCADGLTLRNRLAETPDTPSPLSLTQLLPQTKVDPKEEFLYHTPRATMQGLKDASTDSVFVVVGTIKRVVNKENFWYTACVCSKAVIPDSSMFFCEKCDKHVKKVFPRYCLRVRAIDQTDCATLVIFDRDCSTLFNKSCADLLAEHEVAIHEGQLAPELAALIGKTYLFKVETKADFSPRFEQSFRVRKICLDPAIIKEFMSKWEKEESSFLKLTNESASLSVLMDKGKHTMHIGESSLLSQDPISLSEPVQKIQRQLAKVPESASDVVKQDLMTKFGGVDSEPDCQEIPPSHSASSSSKRASPTNDDDDMNVPIKKLIRRTVKIEKI